MKRKIIVLLLIAVLGPHAVFFGIIFKQCLFLKKHNPASTSLMQYRTKHFGQSILPVEFVPSDNIPEKIHTMAVIMEDFRFYHHWGIDVSSIEAAWDYNRKAGEPVLGASTIHQQLARTLFLNPKKNLFRKYTEAFIAMEMNMVLSKKRVLELYLNYSEWGEGIFGIGQAAKFYYGKNPAELSADEASRMIAVLASPLKFTPQTLEKSAFLQNRYYFLKFSQTAYRLFQDG